MAADPSLDAARTAADAPPDAPQNALQNAPQNAPQNATPYEATLVLPQADPPAPPVETTRAVPFAPPRASVQSAPCAVPGTGGGAPCLIKVDLAVRLGGQVAVAGWCTDALALELQLGGRPLAAEIVTVDRPDVRTALGLDAGIAAGFALLAACPEDAPVELRWARAGSASSTHGQVLVLDSATTLQPSQGSDLGSLAARLHPAHLAEPEPAAPDNAEPTDDVLRPEQPVVPPAAPALLPRRQETRAAASEAVIVGAAGDLALGHLEGSSADIFALNGAHFHLQAHGIVPFALVTGDRRFLVRHGLRNLAGVRKIIAFDYVLDDADREHLAASTIVETFPCRGRDGFSTDAQQGFFHGCSSFFLAVQYLVTKGYKRISTVGVKFPPPELYARVNANVGHPEFVYGTQLANLVPLRRHLNSAGVQVRCRDANTNLALFV